MSVEQQLYNIIKNIEETFSAINTKEQNFNLIDVRKFTQREKYMQMLNSVALVTKTLQDNLLKKYEALKIKHDADLELIRMIAPHNSSADNSATKNSSNADVNNHTTQSISTADRIPASVSFLSSSNNIKQIPPTTEVRAYPYPTPSSTIAPFNMPTVAPPNTPNTPNTSNTSTPNADSSAVASNLIVPLNKTLRGGATTNVPITSKYSLGAIKVSNWTELKGKMTPGNLYYVESTNHFAIIIAGMFIHGNIGRIYTNEKDPVKIKNCLYGSKCTKENCDYYHNPLRSQSTLHNKDCRNYIATSWIYSPPEQAHKNKRKSRRFGDLDHIDFDIEEMSAEEGERYMDQTMHDLLCTILLHQYRKFIN